ncbi:transposase (fragment) [groundwater metagenome]|uniref:Transposase n=1 Tax=groundwater metagenome TaxID=717931 RepID=A0A098ECS4_9ZZZZ
MKVQQALKGDRLMKGVTGMSVREFQELVEKFGKNLKKEKELRYDEDLKEGERERQPGGGRKGNLITVADKLFYILLGLTHLPRKKAP